MQHKFCVQDLLPAACRMPHGAASRCPLPLAGRELNHTQLSSSMGSLCVCCCVCVCVRRGACVFSILKPTSGPLSRTTTTTKKPKRNQPKNKENPPPNRLRSVLADGRNIWVAPCPGRRRGVWGVGLPIVVAGFYSFLICHFW